MAIFDRLDRMTSRAVDRVNAVEFCVTPLISSPNGRHRPDPDRGEILGKGILSQFNEPISVQTGGRSGKSSDFQTMINGRNFVFSVDVNRYPDARKVRQGDRLALDDARVFVVSGINPDGLSRVDWDLQAPIELLASTPN